MCPVGKPGAPPDQFCFFQLGKVLLGLALTNANLESQVAHSGKTPAVLSGLPRKPAPRHLGSNRHQLGADQSFRNEDAGEQAIGIEGLADHKGSWSLTILWFFMISLRRLALDLPDRRCSAPNALYGPRPASWTDDGGNLCIVHT